MGGAWVTTDAQCRVRKGARVCSRGGEESVGMDAGMAHRGAEVAKAQDKKRRFSEEVHHFPVSRTLYHKLAPSTSEERQRTRRGGAGQEEALEEEATTGGRRRGGEIRQGGGNSDKDQGMADRVAARHRVDTSP